MASPPPQNPRVFKQYFYLEYFNNIPSIPELLYNDWPGSCYFRTGLRPVGNLNINYREYRYQIMNRPFQTRHWYLLLSIHNFYIYKNAYPFKNKPGTRGRFRKGLQNSDGRTDGRTAGLTDGRKFLFLMNKNPQNIFFVEGEKEPPSWNFLVQKSFCNFYYNLYKINLKNIIVYKRY